jgi:glycosyltransferase involved in cell wall biosynthesis
LRSLGRILRVLQPDVVHTLSSKAWILGRFAARCDHVPAVVHTVHGWAFHEETPPWTRAAYVSLERHAARWTDRIVTVSNLDRDKGLRARIGAPSQYRTIHEIDDLSRYSSGAAARSAARGALRLPLDAFVVGTVGRLSEQKDPETWVRTAALVADRAPHARFVMVGDGGLRPVVERLAAECGIADRLLLTGLRDDVPEILPAFDVLLLTSRWEGLPLVIPEAMASGVAVVASAVDGNREVVRDGHNGLLAAPSQPVRFADAVLRLHDRDLVAALVAEAHETARGFSRERTVPQLEQLYTDCVRDRSATPSGPAGPPVGC